MYLSHAAGNKAPAKGIAISVCPYKNVQSVYCSASVMKMPIDRWRNETTCLTEDFDCCPVFLAKVLRGT
jgi:hypothetical protein